MIRNEQKNDIKTIRYDNSGENNSLKENIKADTDLKINFEFTAPDTPQHSGHIKRKFQTLYGKIEPC
jgi:hypothetical protein